MRNQFFLHGLLDLLQSYMPRGLPPLTALRAFEAAARHASLTRAAEELCVTPAAVGQQVRVLEAHLGCRLLVRDGRGLALTAEARELLPDLSESFRGLTRTMQAFERGRHGTGPLVISVLPSFASRWLLPRLDTFYDAYPAIELRIDASTRVSDFDREDVDIAIRYRSAWRDGEAGYDVLLADAVYPVASPAPAEPGLASPEDLSGHVLLHDDWRGKPPGWPDWPAWLDAAGVGRLQALGHRRFSVSAHVIQAALAGHGIALAHHVLVADDVAVGALVRPFETSLQTPFSYQLITSRSQRRRAERDAFLCWLRGQAGAFPQASGVRRA